LREQRDVERRNPELRQRRGDREPREDGDPAPARRHGVRPNSPCGRNAMISATGTKIVKYENSGKSALPNALTSPISRLPTSAPVRLPIPPTMANASGSSSPSSPGYALVIGPPSSPPAPASNAPSANTR